MQAAERLREGLARLEGEKRTNYIAVLDEYMAAARRWGIPYATAALALSERGQARTLMRHVGLLCGVNASKIAEQASGEKLREGWEGLRRLWREACGSEATE